MFLSALKTASKSFGVQLTAWVLLLLCATNFIDFAVSHHVISSALESHDKQELLNELYEYSAAYRSNGMNGIAKKAEYEYQADGSLLIVVRLLSPSGAILFSNDDPQRSFRLEELQRMPIEDGRVTSIASDSTPARLEIVRKRFDDGNELQIVDTTEDRDEILRTVEGLFGLTFLPILLLTGIGGLLLARRALSPVRQLIELLESILKTGQLSSRAPLRGAKDELDSLSTLFNSLLERISGLLETMRNSLDNVAHDLRTPMTRFRGNAELALRENEIDPLRESLMNAIEESDRILTTLHTLMDISEAEAGAMDLNIQPIALSALVDRVVSLYEFVADERRIEVTSSIAKDLQLRVDVDRMTQALANLLDNALKYTPEHGTVEFVASRKGEKVELAVTDSGIGIPPEDMPHIFERLYRGDKSRSSRGYGLGLSLVKAITSAHGISIQVDSTPGNGSTFRLTLPQ